MLPGERKDIGTGVAFNIADRNLAGIIVPRSGLGKRGVWLANAVGVIDSDYQGEVIVCVLNRSDEPLILHPLDRIAQMLFVRIYHPVEYHVVDDFGNTTIRGAGGFGSTGIK